MSIEDQLKNIENFSGKSKQDLKLLLKKLIESVEQKQIKNCNGQTPPYDYRSFLNNNAPRVSKQIDWTYGKKRVRESGKSST